MSERKPFLVYFAEGCTRCRLGPLGLTLQAHEPDPNTGQVPPIEVTDKKVIKFILRWPGTLRFNPQSAVDLGYLKPEELQRLGHDVQVPLKGQDGKPVLDENKQPVVDTLVGQFTKDERLPPGTPDFPKMSLIEQREVAEEFEDADGKAAPIHLPLNATKDEIVDLLEDAYVERDKVISQRASKAAGSNKVDPPAKGDKPKGGGIFRTGKGK